LVATQILLTQRAEALQSLTETLAALEGADPDVVRETAARAAAGRPGGPGLEYMSAVYMSQMADVLADQQRRLEELEAQTTKRGRSKK
jgi:hypothetical protein